MRVKARCRYRNFKDHVTTAARANRKRVASQDRHVVGKFVVAAVHDFVDTCKDRFLTRVKLLHQQTRFPVAEYVSKPVQLGGIVLFGSSHREKNFYRETLPSICLASYHSASSTRLLTPTLS